MEIRLAEEKDAKAVADIIKRHSQDDYMGYVTFDHRYIIEKMKKNNFYFVAESKDVQSTSNASVIGCIRASIVDLDLAEIRTMCVDEPHRRKGVASRLLEEALELLKEKKMRKVVARSKADAKEAMAFFEKNGFVKEGFFKEHYRKGIDIVQFGKFI